MMATAPHKEEQNTQATQSIKIAFSYLDATMHKLSDQGQGTLISQVPVDNNTSSAICAMANNNNDALCH